MSTACWRSAKAEALGQDSGVLGEVYREIKRKDLLHLAVLLHDLGKGQEEDHSDVGSRLPEETAIRLGFDEQETQDAHAFSSTAICSWRTRPFDGIRTTKKWSCRLPGKSGTPEVLGSCSLLTAADIAAVGPGVLTKWKESLLIELYLRDDAGSVRRS